MHDALLKSVFADRRMAEILIRRHAPEWASEIDSSTLREESTGLVSKKTLQRRHLGLARNLSPEDMAGQLSALWRTIERHGDPGLAGLMGQSVDTMLELRDYPEGLMKGGVTTMAEVVDRFRQGMDELVQRGEAQALRRQVTRRFGEETAGRLSRLLDGPPAPEDIDRVTDALVECATGDEFIERVRMG